MTFIEPPTFIVASLIIGSILGLIKLIHTIKEEIKFYNKEHKSIIKELCEDKLASMIVWFMFSMLGFVLVFGMFMAYNITVLAINYNNEIHIKNEHRQNPCPQCHFKKIETTFYDKNGIEHKDIKFLWQNCPTLEIK